MLLPHSLFQIFTLPFLLLPSPMRFGFSSSGSADDTAPLPFGIRSVSTTASSDTATSTMPCKTSTIFTLPSMSSSTVSSVSKKPCDSIYSASASSSPFACDTVLGSSASTPRWLFGSSCLSISDEPCDFSTIHTFSCSPSFSPSPVAGDTTPRWLFGPSYVSTAAASTPSKTSVFLNFPSSSVSSSPVARDTAPPWLIRATAASTDAATMPWFTKAISSATTSANTTSLTVSHIPPSDSLLSVTSLSSVSAITTTVKAASSSQPQSTVSAPESVTVPACSLERDEVAAILASKCEKLQSCRAARQAQGRGQNERHDSVAKPWNCVTMEFETTSSNKPVGDSAHTPAAIAEQNYAESKLCCVPISGAPSTSTPSEELLDSKLGSSLFPSMQPSKEEQPYLPPVDLMHSTIDMWKRVVANKKTDQEVIDEGLRHFYEGINYFCLLSERLQVATDKYNEAAKARDDMEKLNSSLKDKLAEASRKVEDSEEKERLEHELAGAANKIIALTGEKESIIRVQMILHQTISELRRELEEAGPAAIQKYKASSLYRQELMEYAAPYVGKGVKLAIEKIKAKDPTFDPEAYGLEMYILPPEADDLEFSSEEKSDSGCQS